MKVTIIIPVYNVEDYLEKCLVSVANQTYNGELECLIIDDCGCDRSIPIAIEFISRYEGSVDFLIIHRNQNGGLSAARNTGIAHATGEYVYFLDSDDYIEPRTIEWMVETLSEYPDSEIVQAGVVGAKPGSFLSIAGKNLPQYTSDKLFLKKAYIQNRYPVTAWNKLVNLAWLKENNLYFAEGILHEDEEWNWRISKHINRVSICGHETYNYLVRSGSIVTDGAKMDKRIDSLLYIYNMHVDTFDSVLSNYQCVKIYNDFLQLKHFELNSKQQAQFETITSLFVEKFSSIRYCLISHSFKSVQSKKQNKLSIIITKMLLWLSF